MRTNLSFIGSFYFIGMSNDEEFFFVLFFFFFCCCCCCCCFLLLFFYYYFYCFLKRSNSISTGYLKFSDIFQRATPDLRSLEIHQSPACEPGYQVSGNVCGKFPFN